MTVHQYGCTQTRQSCVLSNKRLVNGWRGNDNDWTILQNFLKCSRVVIGVTMGQNNSHDRTSSYTIFFETCIGVWWWINHDTATIDPKHVSGCAAIFVKTVTVSQHGNTKGWRIERWGYRFDFADTCDAVFLGNEGTLWIFIAGRLRRIFLFRYQVAESVHMHALWYLYVTGKPGTSNNKPFLIHIVHHIPSTTGQSKNLHPLDLILSNGLLTRTSRVNRSNPPVEIVQRKRPILLIRIDGIVVIWSIIIIVVIVTVLIIPIQHFLKLIGINGFDTTVLFFKANNTTNCCICIFCRLAHAVLRTITARRLGKMNKIQQSFNHQFIPILPRSKMFEFRRKIGYSITWEIWCKILFFVRYRIIIAKLRRSQQGFIKHASNAVLRLFTVHYQGASSTLDEEIKICWKFKFCQIYPQRRSHVAAEAVYRYNIHHWNAKTQIHAVLDGFGGYAELYAADGFGFHAHSTAGKLCLVQKWDGFVSDGRLNGPRMPSVAHHRIFVFG
mmetsp:Transcript_15717/g.23236  ORF Transcript_15717/g.23236 Transcript_15717/m.23236 type:complete len:499 (-) Transcript_15717:622-2118(-)